MKSIRKASLGLATLVLAACALSAQAQVRITEVAPWASGNAPYATDWFELTNIGSSAVNITGWKMDDSSSGSAKVALVGISSIGAGESVIFTETAAKASFLSTWFGTSAPSGLQIGTYTGAGVGLSTSGDAVNVFDAGGSLQAKVTFGVADAGSPFQTFDNAAKLDGVAISQLSLTGTNGAFASVSGTEIGSPGTIAAVPEPETFALMLAGLGLLGVVVRKRKSA